MEFEVNNIKLDNPYQSFIHDLLKGPKMSMQVKYRHFCITGVLSLMTREEARLEIQSKGGYFDKSICRNTHYLVTGQSVGQTKLNKAMQYGIKILTEKEFLDALKGVESVSAFKATVATPVAPKVEPKPINNNDLHLESRDW